MKPKEIKGVPDQEKGSFHDTESIRLSKDHESTVENYANLKDRLLSVNYWNYYTKDVGADFKLHDLEGNLKKRLPEKGDYVRIDIPGPGNFEARGFDWVQITKMYENKSEEGEILESLFIECRPSTTPENVNSHIAHFYAAEATSTIIISRSKDYISGYLWKK